MWTSVHLFFSANSATKALLSALEASGDVGMGLAKLKICFCREMEHQIGSEISEDFLNWTECRARQVGEAMG